MESTRERTVSIGQVEDHIELNEHGVTQTHSETEVKVTETSTTPKSNAVTRTRNMLFLGLRLICCYFSIQAFVLVLILTLEICLSLCFAFALPASKQQAEDVNVPYAAFEITLVILLFHVSVILNAVLVQLFFGIRDIFSSRTNPLLQARISSVIYGTPKGRKTMEGTDSRDTLFEVIFLKSSTDYKEIKSEKTLFHTEEKEEPKLEPGFVNVFHRDDLDILDRWKRARPTLRFFAIVVQACVVLAASIYALTADNAYDGLSNFLTFGLFCGVGYSILWFLLRWAQGLRFLYDEGKSTNGAVFSSIKSELQTLGLWPESQFTLKFFISWFFIFGTYLVVIILPMATVKQLGAAPHVMFVTFILSFFGFPYITLRWAYRLRTANSKSQLAIFIVGQLGLLLSSIILCLLLSLFVAGTTDSTCPTSLGVEKNTTTALKRDVYSSSPAITSTATACTMNWQGLSSLDLAIFSYIVYYDDGEVDSDNCINKEKYIKEVFPDEDWVHIPTDKNSKNRTFASWDHYYSQQRNLSVITIRGTVPQHVTDILQDIDLFNEAAILQLSTFIIPIVNYWSNTIVADFIYYASVVNGFFPVKDWRYYYAITDYTRTVPANYPGDIILTGHSLGGALAKIVGAEVGSPAVTYASPGTAWSTRKFGITNTTILDNYVTTFMPDHDVVSKVDKQTGTTVKIPCFSTSSLTCHGIVQTICSLWKLCDFPSNRNMTLACTDWI